MNPTTILAFIQEQDRIVQVQMLRTIANSLLAQLIGTLRKAVHQGMGEGDFQNLASLYRAQAVAAQQVHTLAQRQFEEPMAFGDMVEFFKTSTKPLNREVLDTVSQTTGLTENQLEQMHHNRQEKDRQRMEADEPALTELYNQLVGEIEVSDDLELLTVLEGMDAGQIERLGTKLREGLARSVGKLAEVVVSQGRTDLLSDLTVMKAAEADYRSAASAA